MFWSQYLDNYVEKMCAVKDANQSFKEDLRQGDTLELFAKWKQQISQNAMAKSMFNYMERVETITTFVAASRNADLDLHLEAGEALSKLFFAMDRLKYKRLWPRYLADMNNLKTVYADTWRELQKGCISVTKSSIPFVSLGANHALE